MQRQQKQISALSKDTEILDIDDDYDYSDSESVESTPVSSAVQSNGKNKPPLLKAKSFQVETKKKEFKRTNTETSIKSEDLPSSDSDSEDDSAEEINGHDKDDDWSGEVVVSHCLDRFFLFQRIGEVTLNLRTCYGGMLDVQFLIYLFYHKYWDILVLKALFSSKQDILLFKKGLIK